MNGFPGLYLDEVSDSDQSDETNQSNGSGGSPPFILFVQSGTPILELEDGNLLIQSGS